MDSPCCLARSLQFNTNTLQCHVKCIHALSFWDGSMGQQSSEVCSTQVHQVQDTQTLLLLTEATSAADQGQLLGRQGN